MKKYFKLIKSRKRKIIGSVFTQSETMIDDYNFDSPNSVHNWYWNNMIPYVDGVQLKKSAKLTDLINAIPVSKGLIVSDKMLTLLYTHNIGTAKHVSCKVFDAGGTIHQYYYFYFPNGWVDDLADLKKSSFKADSKFLSNKNNPAPLPTGIKCPNLESIYEIGSKMGYLLKYEKLYFKEECTWDIFDFKYGPVNFIVSERLKSAIEQAKLTGMEFEPIDFEIHQPIEII